MRFLAIDPSLNSLGWALYDTKVGNYDVLANWNFGRVCPRGQGREEKLANIKEYFVKADASHLVCEAPAFFETEKGRIAAKEGYTINLALIVGTIYGCIPNVKLCLYTPMQWKGAVPKAVTEAKFKRTFSDNGQYLLVDDVVDAIMMLTFHLNRFYGIG